MSQRILNHGMQPRTKAYRQLVLWTVLSSFLRSQPSFRPRPPTPPPPALPQPIRIVSLGGLVARSCAFSVDGQQLAVGCANGGIQVLEFHPSVRQVGAAGAGQG